MSDGDISSLLFQLWALLYILEYLYITCRFGLAASVDALSVLAVYPIYHTNLEGRSQFQFYHIVDYHLRIFYSQLRGVI